jgi:hypothetical protein
MTTGYDASSWSNGVALLWTLQNNGAFVPANSDVPAGSNMAWTNQLGATNITYYLRTPFEMPTVPADVQAWSLQMHAVIDDGVVIYFNGQEATRIRMSTNAPTWSTFASGNGSNFRYDATIYTLPTTNVTFGGQNLMAVELHQSSLTSSDVSFASDVYIAVPALVMEVGIVRSGSNVTLSWPPVTGYRLYAADSLDGPFAPVLSGGNPVTTPYAVPAPLAAKKFYRLQNP